MHQKALQGLKVAGFVTGGVGPIITKTLATHGATVVIIESGKKHNITRSGGPFKDNLNGINRSYSFAFVNTDKYSLALDLKHPRAKEVTQRLVQWADIIVENWRPTVMERWGLGYKDISTINPDVIMASFSHEGRGGPHGEVPGAGPALSALSGLIELTGWPDRPPVTLPAFGILPDYIAPRFGVFAILAAVDYRRRTGKGQYIDLSEYETSIQFQIPAILDYTVNKRIQRRDGNRSPYAAPHGVYPCQGVDKWCAIAIFTETEWEAFCKVLGNPLWTQDPKFKTMESRKKHEDMLNKYVAEWTLERKPEDIMVMMQSAGVEAGAVRNIGDVVEACPQLAHRGFWWTLEHPEIGKTINAGSSYILSKTSYHLEKPAPCFGEHTEYVCTEFLGMSDEEFIDLFQEEVFV
ncbi:MAG: CoA transferase [Deltaproteobacteria bacterium]|nr:CoA transferase [Deltaproteobacteria bacterium]